MAKVMDQGSVQDAKSTAVNSNAPNQSDSKGRPHNGTYLNVLRQAATEAQGGMGRDQKMLMALPSLVQLFGILLPYMAGTAAAATG